MRRLSKCGAAKCCTAFKSNWRKGGRIRRALSCKRAGAAQANAFPSHLRPFLLFNSAPIAPPPMPARIIVFLSCVKAPQCSLWEWLINHQFTNSRCIAADLVEICAKPKKLSRTIWLVGYFLQALQICAIVALCHLPYHGLNECAVRLFASQSVSAVVN